MTSRPSCFSSTMSCSTTTLSDASYSFDAPDADAVLLSSDVESPAEFRVHRCILAVASPFFRDMFSLPQDQSTLSTSGPDNAPRIPVAESREVLETLLRFVYPIPDPIIFSLDELDKVLAAAVKYEFEAVVASLRGFLISPPFLQESPIRVYALACRYGLEDEAKIASRYTLGTDLLHLKKGGLWEEDLKNMLAWDFHKLLMLHRRRSEAAIEFIKRVREEEETKVDGESGMLVKCVQCNSAVFPLQWKPPRWWIEWEWRAVEELGARPTTDVVFGLDFLYGAARKGGCPRCMGNVVESWKVLRDLKDAIDSLPSTI